MFRPSSGGSDDYFYSQGIPISFTIEMRDTGKYGFLMPEEQIIPNAEENIIGVQTVLEGVDTLNGSLVQNYSLGCISLNRKHNGNKSGQI